MDTVNYYVGEHDAIELSQDTSLIKVKATAFSGDVSPVISSYRKLYCMNVKTPNVLRVMNRQAKFAEHTLTMPHIRSLATSEGTLERCVFYAAGGQTVSFITPRFQANGEVQIEAVEVNVGEEVYGVAPSENDCAVVLGAQHIFEVNPNTKEKTATMDLAPRTAVTHSAVFDYHSQAKLAIAPSKSACLDLISLSSHKTVLQKPWEPHNGNQPTAAYIFKHRTFADEPEDGIHILTSANKNTEIRLWTYSRHSKSFKLQQEILINSDYASNSSDNFILSVTNQEEYVVLASTVNPVAVVIELHRSSLKSARLTTWQLKEPALAMIAVVGKTVAKPASMSVNYQLSLIIRSATEFSEVAVDVNRLANPPTTTAAKTNRVAAWFGDSAAASGASLRQTSPATLAHTAVSSTLAGDKATQRAASSMSQHTAATVIRQQATNFCATLHEVDVKIVELQKKAAEVMGLFQEGKSREEAQLLGQKFAMRNRSRLEQVQQQRTPASVPARGMMSTSQQELMLSLREFTETLPGKVAAVSKKAVVDVLHTQLKTAVENAAKELEFGDAPIANIRATESGQQVNEALDAIIADLVRRMRDHQTKMKTTIKASSNATTKCSQDAKHFLLSLRDEMRNVRAEMEETNKAVAEVQASSAVRSAPVSPEELVSRAIALAEEGKWMEATTVAVEAADITVLLGFLQSSVCNEHMQTLTSPQTLPLITFVNVCVQLSHELSFQLGSVPLRVQLLYAFYIDWDDKLSSLKNSAASADSVSLQVARKELAEVLQNLEDIDDKKDVDRKTKNNIRLLKKLIKAFIN